MNIAVGFVCLVIMAVVEGLPNPEEESLSSGDVRSESGAAKTFGTNCTPVQWAAATAECAIKDISEPWKIPVCIAKTCIHFENQVCSKLQNSPYRKQCTIIQQTVAKGDSTAFDMDGCISHLCAGPKDKCVGDETKLADIATKCMRDRLLQCSFIPPGECIFNVGTCIYQLCHVQDTVKQQDVSFNQNFISKERDCGEGDKTTKGDDRYTAQCVGIVNSNTHGLNITIGNKTTDLNRCEHAHCIDSAPTDTQVGATINLNEGAHCDCHYVPFKFGCVIKTALNIPGFACRCVVVWTHCDGEVVNCKEGNGYFCEHPDKSYLSCVQGGGNCKGYHI